MNRPTLIRRAALLSLLLLLTLGFGPCKVKPEEPCGNPTGPCLPDSLHKPRRKP